MNITVKVTILISPNCSHNCLWGNQQKDSLEFMNFFSSFEFALLSLLLVFFSLFFSFNWNYFSILFLLSQHSIWVFCLEIIMFPFQDFVNFCNHNITKFVAEFISNDDIWLTRRFTNNNNYYVLCAQCSHTRQISKKNHQRHTRPSKSFNWKLFTCWNNWIENLSNEILNNICIHSFFFKCLSRVFHALIYKMPECDNRAYIIYKSVAQPIGSWKCFANRILQMEVGR